MTVRKRAMLPTLAVAGLIAAGCGSSNKTTTTAAGTHTPASHATPSISADSFTNDFSSMNTLKSLGSTGKGKIAVILPDTTSSTRYVEFDAPMLRQAMVAAGVPSSDIIIQNAQGSDSTFLTDAQTDITNGASIILSDPEDSGTGASVEKYANAHGAKVIDYDRLTLGGSRPYYVSFNNVTVGKMIGDGLVSCVADWKVSSPRVIVMHGAATDNNATLFAQGYNSVIDPLFASGKWKVEERTAGTWDPPTALTEFQTAYTAHKTANAALIPNDETGAPIVTYLKTHGVKPQTFPTTGQDATLTGLQNVLSGYQCGTVYKAIYKEAQAAVALAVYLRASKTPPASLVNGTTEDINEHKAVPSVLLQPQWVTPKNMNSTVIADKFVPANQLCAGSYAEACKKAGISS
jgi:D-xylose transport system substrate-binding protein